MKHNTRRGWTSERQNTISGLLAKKDFLSAAKLCRGWLAETPDNPELLHQLGVISEQLGLHREACDLLQRARRLSSPSADLCNNLAIALESTGDLQAAETAYYEALRINPHHPESHGNLATLLLKVDRPAEALTHAEQALKLQPNNPLHWVAAGDAFQVVGRFEEAAEVLRHALTLSRVPRRAYTSLARIYFLLRRDEDALFVLQKAIDSIGEDPLLLNDLAMALGSLKRYEEAQPLFERAYEQLQDPVALFNIVQNLSRMKCWEDLFALEAEVLRHPQPNTAIPSLFGAAASTCNWDLIDRLLPHVLEWFEAEESNKITVAIQNVLYLMPQSSVAPMDIRRTLERVAQKKRKIYSHSQPAFDYAPAFETQKKLRIGYLSGDFRVHAVNTFFSGLLSFYDKAYFEVYCYSNLSAESEDDITAQYKRAVDAFINVSEMNDIELAQRIHSDGIHILIDLSGYTAASRLSVMFYRPAPVQACYLGYPFTTGMEEVDYYLADRWLNGPENARHFTERILEIEASFITTGEHTIYPRSFVPPVQRNGYITFGSLTNCYKLNREVIATWSRVVLSVPNARIILNHPNYSLELTRSFVLNEFEKHGVSQDRVTLVWDRHPEGSHLYWYEDIDIALDTFPLTGGTTTFESLWMGVPMITHVGDVYYERLSCSILMNCGVAMDDLIANDEDEFVAKAMRLAGDPEKVANLRQVLCEELPRSILCDASRHVRFFEQALIEGWNGKFPERPLYTPANYEYLPLSTPAAPWVATVNVPGNLHRYVVQEQGRWFAPEYSMLSILAPHVKGIAVEIGSEPGYFSLELAQSGVPAISLSTSTVSAKLTEAAAMKAQIADSVHVVLESPLTGLLDRLERADVGILRIGVEANDGRAGVVEQNPYFWTHNRPLVLLGIHSKDQPDLSVAGQLSKQGYIHYRFVPGVMAFQRHSFETALDPYVLYLLACPEEHVDRLKAAGLVIDQLTTLPEQQMLALMSAGQSADPQSQLDEWVVGAAMRAYDALLGLADRLTSLMSAIEVQESLLQSAPSITRRLTLARLLSDAGRRAEAVAQLSLALSEIEQGSSTVTMPFLAPSATWDTVASGDHLAEWLFSSILETRCRLAAHSTYFLSPQDVSQLELLNQVGMTTEFSRKVLQLQTAV